MYEYAIIERFIIFTIISMLILGVFMFTKKYLCFVALFFLVSNGLMQSMDVTVRDGWRTVQLKPYNKFVNVLPNVKYSLKDNDYDEFSKPTLKKLIELAAESSDSRYLQKLMECEPYASVIKSKGLAIFRFPSNEQVKNIKLLLNAGADVNAIVREADEHCKNKTLLQGTMSCTRLCHMSPFLVAPPGDEVMKLLIKRGADIAIQDRGHPTLLHLVEYEIAKEAKEKNVKERIDLLTKVKDLLTNAVQIRANYLQKQAEKPERQFKIAAAFHEQEKLKNIKADQILTVRDKNFRLHRPILLARCDALLKV
jgi:hypothetical protein